MLSITAQPVPLRMDADGVVRVGGTRVTLDTVVAAFHEGATPEEIAQEYASLELADVYAALSFYLRQQAEVDAYLRERAQQAERSRRRNEARLPRNGLRERLLARRSG